uniref:ABC-type xenobiotic transporter n=1 Tax=Fagus sylvatica TaxID=28930 RepID=A0A2N9GWU5_FAGSY
MMLESDSEGLVTPFAKAGFFSRMSFWWLNPLMKRGRKKTLEDEDIPKLREEDQAENCNLLFLEQLNKQKRAEPSSQTSILRAIILIHWKEIFLSGCLALLYVLTLSTGPLLLNAFVLASEGKENFNGASNNCCMVVTILTVLCNIPLAKFQHKFQSKLTVAQDERLKASSEALVNMKVLKLYAWETDFKKVIENLRKVEYKWLSKVQLEKAYNILLFWSTPALISSATFGACYFLRVPLHANNVFTFVATFRPCSGCQLHVKVYGKISYVSQTAWIQSGTIQENILFGSAMDSERYKETLERCSLVKDLELLPFGDLTEIGERGVNLSGGQKQRVQLAPMASTIWLGKCLQESLGLKNILIFTVLLFDVKWGNPYKKLLIISCWTQAKNFRTLLMHTKRRQVLKGLPANSWMAANVDNPHVTTLRLVMVYMLVGLASMLFLLCRSLSTVAMGLKSSESMFSQLLDSLFHAPMSFYDSTPLGRILSRVSSDLSIIDLDVPSSLDFYVAACINASSILVVLAVVTWEVLFVTIPLVYLAISLQRYYFASAKELMRMNGTTKSLVANHLAESAAGAITIRAFKKEDRFFTKNLDLIDTNASPFFHSFSANEWLIQWIELVSSTVLASAALCMVLLPPRTFSSGFIGMALSYGLSLNMMFVRSLQKQCTLANDIVSVERLNQYMYIPSEAPEVIEGNRPTTNWPAVGKVEIQDLQVRYRPNAPLVLCGISCTFEGGHKIGIVGRTGSGKTTLISALFRLVEPAGGKIIVDGIDISTIGLHDLRSRFGIIPQDPTLFNGTVLGKCQLQESLQEKGNGLDSLVVEYGSNWSMGQRQLFCLGRALLRRCKILVLDEATASIDNATDMILQKTIRIEFADCTVITVAHRIPTVMDCTMVLAISDGKVVEYDEPTKLMKTEGSLFGQLVKEYWSNLQFAQSH